MNEINVHSRLEVESSLNSENPKVKAKRKRKMQGNHLLL